MTTRADLTQPRGIADGFAAAWNRQDADAIAALFTPDATFVNVVGFWWTSQRQIRFNHAYGFAHMFPDSTMHLTKVSTRPLTDDVAVVVAGWSMVGQTGPDGSRGGERTGVLSFTVTRQPAGQWLAVHAHNTDRIPHAQTHLVTGEGHRPASYE
jgi:uncharacterized protein (TIGR02246 family)